MSRHALDFGRDGPRVGAPPPRIVRLGVADFDVQVLALAAPNRNQDAHLITSGFVGVSDGAAPLDPSRGAQVAAFAARALEHLYDHRALDAPAMVRRAITAGRGRHTRESTPVCTVGVARVRGDDLEVNVLGDTSVFVRTTGGVLAVKDTRIDPFDQRSGQAVRDGLRTGQPFADAKQAIRPLLEAQYTHARNRDGGYWVVAEDPTAADHVITRSVPLDDLETVLVCSDGFTRFMDVFEARPTPETFLWTAEQLGLAKCGRVLRALEKWSGSMTTYARTSVHDDATAVLLTRRAPA